MTLTGRSRVWTLEAHFSAKVAIFESIMTSQWQLETKFDNFSSTYRILLYGRSFCQILKWFWDVDPKFGLEKRISGKNWSFLVKNDVTAAVRNRIWWPLFDFFVSLLCKIIFSKFEVILLSRSRVWTWAVHFTTKFGHLIVKNDVTMAVRKQFSFYFFAKINYLYVGDYFGEVWSDSGKWNTKFHSRSGSNVVFLDF